MTIEEFKNSSEALRAAIALDYILLNDRWIKFIEFVENCDPKNYTKTNE